MPEEATVKTESTQDSESTVSDEQIDAILESSSEESGEAESGQAGGAGDLSYHLKTIGLSKEEIPSDLSNLSVEDVQALAAKVAAKADERIRGMQSGFKQSAQESLAKAARYDQLMALPQVQEALGTKPEAPKIPSLSDINLDDLPTDPVKRAEALIGMGAKGALAPDIQAVRDEIGNLKSIMGNMVWENFLTAHPDAAQGQPIISRLVSSGLNLNDAYRAYKGMNTDPAEIERNTLKAVQRRIAEKNRVSGLPLSVHASGTDTVPASAERVNKLAEKQGDSQTFMQLLAEHAEKTGF